MEGIKEVSWYDEDNYCKKAVDELLQEYQDDKDGEDEINFSGEKITSLAAEIENYLGDERDDYEIIGIYLNRKIYRIKDRLYYLTDESYSFNGYYEWTLQEVGKKCYEYFDM